jgi:hypothetical protein
MTLTKHYTIRKSSSGKWVLRIDPSIHVALEVRVLEDGSLEITNKIKTIEDEDQFEEYEEPASLSEESEDTTDNEDAEENEDDEGVEDEVRVVNVEEDIPINLGEFGYKFNGSEGVRRVALSRAVQCHGKTAVIQCLEGLRGFLDVENDIRHVSRL